MDATTAPLNNSACRETDEIFVALRESAAATMTQKLPHIPREAL